MFGEPGLELRSLSLMGRVAAFARSRMNGSKPLKEAIKQTTGTMPLPNKQKNRSFPSRFDLWFKTSLGGQPFKWK